MSFPTGYYIVRPVGVPEGYNISRGPLISRPPEFPASVDRIREVWQVIGYEDNFRLLAGLGKPGPYQPKWVNKDNALYVTSPGTADNFRIESAGKVGREDVWVIGIPNQDLVLTYDAGAYPQLTFRHANGTNAQRFVFEHPA